ncbi:heterokaryon incompatibility protein-domain-containing protein [Apiospora sp. TS-2023a]
MSGQSGKGPTDKKASRKKQLDRTAPSRGSRSEAQGPLPSIPVRASHGIFDSLKENEIRLIRLLPEYMSMIQCEITHISLNETSDHEYTAISYTWGDPDDTVEIRLNNAWIRVTASLHGALKALRKTDEAVLIWADAICINQSNKTEQSSQVQLMGRIYSRAKSVMVWLGAESHDSDKAFRLMRDLQSANVQSLIESESRQPDFDALVNLFERDYWGRVWVVQEILNAKSVNICCGKESVSSQSLLDLVKLLEKSEDQLRSRFPPDKKNSRHHQSYAHVLISGGPSGVESLRVYRNKGAKSLLDVLRLCRTKHASQPRDKVYGILGILHESVQSHLFPDYNASLRQVYTDVVDFLLHSTRRLDVICESIHSPLHSSSASLPTWVPDWSQVQNMAGLGRSYEFSASGETEAKFEFPDSRQRTKLKITTIQLGVVETRGIAVGTYCGLDDTLMAFLHWRAKMLATFPEDGAKKELTVNDHAFCRTISFDQKNAVWEESRNHDETKDEEKDAWTEVCYHAFAALINKRLPSIPLGDKLQAYIEAGGETDETHTTLDEETLEEERKILQERCESRMMGRCFFITKNGKLGMGTGFLDTDDIICVPFGCCTPIILRKEGDSDEYRFIGDCYVDGYMNGEVIQQWKDAKEKEAGKEKETGQDEEDGVVEKHLRRKSFVLR